MSPRLRFFRASLSAVACIYIFFGMDARFYGTVAPFVYAPINLVAWLPPLREHGFVTLEIATLVTLVLAGFGKGGRAMALAGACLFLLLNGYVASFSAAVNWNVHLNIMLFLMVFAGPGGPEEKHLLLGLRLMVVFVYEQAFLSKVLASGPAWFFSGETLRVSAYLIDTATSRWLARIPELFPIAGAMTVLIECLVPPFLLNAKTRQPAAIALIGFHVATFAMVYISFWHLWLLYPALFLSWPEKKRTAES